MTSHVLTFPIGSNGKSAKITHNLQFGLAVESLVVLGQGDQQVHAEFNMLEPGEIDMYLSGGVEFPPGTVLQLTVREVAGSLVHKRTPKPAPPEQTRDPHAETAPVRMIST